MGEGATWTRSVLMNSGDAALSAALQRLEIVTSCSSVLTDAVAVGERSVERRREEGE